MSDHAARHPLFAQEREDQPPDAAENIVSMPHRDDAESGEEEFEETEESADDSDELEASSDDGDGEG